MLLRSCWLIDCVVFNVLFDSIIIHMEIPALMMKGCCGNGTSSCRSDAESRVMVSSEEPTTGVFCTTRASHDPYRSDVCCDGFYMSIRYYVDMSRYICCTSTCSYSCFSHIEQGINIVTHEILFIWRTTPTPLLYPSQHKPATSLIGPIDMDPMILALLSSCLLSLLAIQGGLFLSQSCLVQVNGIHG